MRKLEFLPRRKQRPMHISCLVTAQLDQRLCFHFFLNLKVKAYSFYNCTGQFLWDPVGNPEDWFSRVVAHLSLSFIPRKRRLHPDMTEKLLTGMSNLSAIATFEHSVNQQIGFVTRSDTNRAVQSQKMVRDWKF